MFAIYRQGVGAVLFAHCELFLVAFFASTCRAEPAIDPDAQVCAFVIGVEKYGPDIPAASKAADGARQFAAAIRNTYGDAAVKCCLTDDQATCDEVRSVLHKIKKVPAGSLVIVYFAGHGVRETYARGSTLYLCLYGSTPTDYLNKSIEARNLWEGLAYTKYTNAMIFLDCCYSGSDESDVVADAELNNANIRAFLMCSCAKNEQATGDIFTKAVLEEWKTAHRPDGRCMGLDEFEEAVKTRVRERDAAYMTPGIAFKTKITRCVTQMNGPSALLTFTFPKGCKAGLTFIFDDKIVEQGFQYAKDLFFVSQVSLDHPLKVLVKGPGNADIAGPMVIDREYQPRRIISVPINVPDEYAMANTGASLNEAVAYQKLAEIVEAYGEAPQEYYAAAAERTHDADPSTDISWLLRKAAKYEPENEVYALAARARQPSDALVAMCAVHPSVAVNTINRLERVGANAAAGELGFQVAYRLPPEAQSQRSVMLARSIGNFKLANKPERLQASLTLLAATKPDSTTQSLVAACVAKPVDNLSIVWNSLPMSDWQWASFKNEQTRDNHPEHVWVARLAAREESTAATLGAAEKLLYAGEAGGYVGDVIGNRVFVNPRGTIPSERHALQCAAIIHGNEKFQLLAPTQYDAVSFLMARQGFSTKCDSRRCLISANHNAPKNGSKPIRFPGPLGYECIANSLSTAIEYTTSKVGFAAAYNPANHVNVIYAPGEDVSKAREKPYPEHEAAEFGQWVNEFKDRATAAKYKAATANPTLMKVDGATSPFKLETIKREEAARPNE